MVYILYQDMVAGIYTEKQKSYGPKYPNKMHKGLTKSRLALVCPQSSCQKATVSNIHVGISLEKPLTLPIPEDCSLVFLIKRIYCSNYILFMILTLPQPLLLLVKCAFLLCKLPGMG